MTSAKNLVAFGRDASTRLSVDLLHFEINPPKTNQTPETSCMPIFRFNLFLPSPNAALRSPRAFANAAMLGRALHSHTSNGKTQRPLQTNPAATNVTRQIDSNKRKFDRTMSNTSTLGALHEQVFFNENDFDDAIDLISPERPNIQYPEIDSVRYPSLPTVPSSQPLPPSSIPVSWSPSPRSHFEKPGRIPIPSPEPARPAKRTKLPWTKSEPAAFTPLPQDKVHKSPYQWNKSASAVRDEQKEFKKRNKAKLQTIKADAKPMTSVPTQMLSQEQKDVMKAVIDESKSVFFTGSAGTGKSVLMRSIIAKFRDKFRREPDRLAITASTGLAACVIEGSTLHSWAGIGLGKDPAPELVKKIKRNAKIKAKWLRTKVLIVDEISMVDGELFDKLEQIARIIRNNGRPFGGIQLVVTGDFFQLPPVPERNSVAKFAFDAATWDTCIQHTILLTHVFRQKDPIFASMLNEMRLGKLTPATIKAFQKLSRPLEFRDEVEATELFPTRQEVDNANNSRMQNLSGQSMTFNAVDSGISDLNVRNKLLANFMAPETLTLKKGSQVMLIKNIDTQLVNGSLGKVHAFMDEHAFAFYKDDEETFLRAQDADIDSDNEEKAAAKLKISQMRMKNSETAQRYWPMVRFALPDGTSRDMLCEPEEWKTENQQGEITAKRVQVPLILAWALSIHKAQGQTLNRVKVDLGKVFEKGQAYVALSRATSQAGLQVLRFDQKKVMVHSKVIDFYGKLASAETLAAKQEKKGVSASDYEQQFVDGIDDEELQYMYG